MNRRDILTTATLCAAVVAVPAVAEGIQDMSGWQPIASAPKDGIRVLLFIPAYQVPVHIGWFHDSTTMEYGKIVSESKRWFTANWPPFTGFGVKDPEPSHWAPIPLPPAGVQS